MLTRNSLKNRLPEISVAEIEKRQIKLKGYNSNT
jgi:hypothetical protein